MMNNTNFKLNQTRRRRKKRKASTKVYFKEKRKDTIQQSQGAMSLALQSKRKPQFKISCFFCLLR